MVSAKREQSLKGGSNLTLPTPFPLPFDVVYGRLFKARLRKLHTLNKQHRIIRTQERDKKNKIEKERYITERRIALQTCK